MIAGVATGAIAHGALVADKLGLPFIYVRSGAKEHGLGNQIEGYFEQGQKVVVIEDLISTGGSSLECCTKHSGKLVVKSLVWLQYLPMSLKKLPMLLSRKTAILIL